MSSIVTAEKVNMLLMQLHAKLAEVRFLNLKFQLQWFLRFVDFLTNENTTETPTDLLYCMQDNLLTMMADFKSTSLKLVLQPLIDDVKRLLDQKEKLRPDDLEKEIFSLTERFYNYL